MTARLEGKVALISGGARGQGEAEARRFVAEGAKVVIGDVLDDEGAAVASDIGDAARSVHLDVTDEANWVDAVAATVDAFGGLHVLINNAGILGGFTPIRHTSVDDYVKVLMVNQVGTFLGIKAAAKTMRDSGGGSIVNISSIGGMRGVPFAAPYVSSKFAVRGLTKTAALELGRDGIRVNSVHPGGVDTPMTQPLGAAGQAMFYERLPIQRIATVDDIANMVVFLASDESSYCTGAEFIIDGGSMAGDLSMFDMS